MTKYKLTYDETRIIIMSLIELKNQLIRDGTLEGWRYFDSPRRFGSDYGTQKGWERISDVNEGVSTECGFSQMTADEDIPF